MGDALSLDLALFVGATFGAALVAGVAGFAFGLVAAAVWLHVLTPLQTTTLIVAFGLIVQGYAVWKLRRALSLSRLLPFVLGGYRHTRRRRTPALDAGGVSADRRRAHPPGSVQHLQPGATPAPTAHRGRPRCRRGRRLAERHSGRHDRFGGILPTIWCGVRGWPKDEQRAVFQPTGVAIFLGTALLLGGAGTVTPYTVRLFLIGLPALLLGSWVGLRLYGRLDEAGFRKVVLLLLLVSGIALIAPILFVT